MNNNRKALSIINSVAPIRICDNGGWTDTWFARYGRVFNIGVSPYTEVQIAVFPEGSRPDRIIVHAENYGERYAVSPTNPEPVSEASSPASSNSAARHWDKHPLLEAAIEYIRVPNNLAFEVTIFSEAPGGASTGTSAAVTVALIGALDCLSPGRLTAHEIASAAQRIETEMLGQQCGIQDQLCSRLWWHKLYRYARISSCFGIANSHPECHLVGAGENAGFNLHGEVSSLD